MPRNILIGLTLLLLVAGFASLNDTLLYTPDSARYLIWADALASGDGYAEHTSPEPTKYVIHAPLYPMMLAPVALFAPLSVRGGKVLTLLLGIALVWLLYSWLSRLTNPWFGLGASAFLGIHSLFLVYSTQVLSEIPFAIAIILIVQQFVALGEKQDGIAAYAPLVLALGAGLFLREVGLVLVGSVLVLFALRKDWKSLLIVASFCFILYGLWFTRNELIVAPIEQPPLRNSKIFFTHLFTAKTATLAEEFLARIWNNLGIYAGHLTTFIFAPDYVRNMHGLVSIRQPLVSLAMVGVPYAKPLFVAIPAVLWAAALAFRWKSDPVVRTVTYMSVLYAGPILLYPINDIRFLFPVFVLSLITMTIGAFELWSRYRDRVPRSSVLFIAPVLALLLIFPNLSWAMSFFVNNFRLVHDRERFMEMVKEDPVLPDYYLQDLRGAAEWIVEHSRGEEVVFCRRKELALWLEGRKVLDVDPQVTPDNFDHMLRDYGIRYVTTLRFRSGLRENETQLEYSSLYDFRSVAQFGNAEILEVIPKQSGPSELRTIPSDGDSVEVFRMALRILRRGEPSVAESLIVRSEQRIGRWGQVVFHRAVAKALAGHADEAMTLFRLFRSMPQAGSFVQQAWYHQEILDRYQRALEADNPDERANRFHIVAINYWELGYREQSFRMIDSALAAQPAFFPALIFGAIFAYKDGDAEKAHEYYRKAAASQSANLLVVQMGQVFDADGALRGARGASDSLHAMMQKAWAFRAMDMLEDAIGTWLSVLALDPQNLECMKALAYTYSEKQRFGPSRMWARRYVDVDSGDAPMSAFLADIEHRWEVP